MVTLKLANMSRSKDQVSEFEAAPEDKYNPRYWTTKDARDRYLSKGYTHPIAIVIWWTECTVAVVCPYCHRIHKHGCVPPTSRVSHCGYRPKLFLHYTILFLFSEHPEAAKAGLSFDIDKVNRRFKTIGVDAEEATEDSVGGLAGCSTGIRHY